MNNINANFVVSVHDEILYQTGLDKLMVDIVESKLPHETLADRVAEFIYHLMI